MKGKLISIACAIVLAILNVGLLFCNFNMFNFVLIYIGDGNMCSGVALGMFCLFLLMCSALVFLAMYDILKHD